MRWSALLLQLAGLMTLAVFIRSRSSSTTYSSVMLLLDFIEQLNCLKWE